VFARKLPRKPAAGKRFASLSEKRAFENLRESPLANPPHKRQPVGMSDENTLWKGSPSQWLNLGPFSAGLILLVGIGVAGVFASQIAWLAMVIPLGYMTWRYLVVRCQIFELTSQRLRITNGVINQHIDEIELYRVKDTLMVRTWWMRLTGLSSVSMQTSDRSLPTLTIPAIRNGLEFREQLRKQVEIQRDSKRVREMDFDEAGGSDQVDGNMTA
jgi:membrane protein YdbS with pleckstrin-like domain